MQETILEIDPASAGVLSAGIASVIPLIAEPAGGWLEQASDDALVALAAMCPEVPDAAWFSVFNHEVMPYQGVFLDPHAGRGWVEPHRVRSWLRNGPHSALSTGRTDDHLITLLEHACWLLNQCRSDNASAYLSRLSELLDEHLLRWMPPFVASLQLHDMGEPTQASTFYSRVGLLLARRLCAVRRTITASVPTALGEPPSEQLPLRDTLLIPARCGIWLSRRVLERVLVMAEVAPVGERQALIDQILEHQDASDRLQSTLLSVSTLYQELGEALPELATGCDYWAARVLSTLGELRHDHRPGSYRRPD